MTRKGAEGPEAPVRVLLVDDNPDDRALAERHLRRQFPTLEVIEAAEPADLEEALAAGGFDAVVTDFHLHWSDGLTVLRRVKERFPEMPVVMFTGTGTQEIAVEAMKAGLDDYVIKSPRHFIRLASAVRGALVHAADRRAGAAAEERIRTLNRELERRVARLAALRQIDLAITGSVDLRITLQVLLAQVRSQLGVDAAAVLLYRRESQALAWAAGDGFRTDAVRSSAFRLGEGYAGRAALERETLLVADCAESAEPFLRNGLRELEGFVGYCAVPLLAKGQLEGVLECFQRRRLEADADWREFAEALATQAAMAVDNARLFTELQRSNTDLLLAYDATIEGWSQALDLRDEETEGHSRRVTEMTDRLAREVGMGEAEIAHLRRGALLHDVGKLGIPDAILRKPGPLDPAEWEVMRRHPGYAFEWLHPIRFLRPALDVPYAHHERWDGSGYPRGLKGEDIPLAARVFAVVDVWDALTHHRPYRPPWTREEALAYLREQAGRQFDPRVVETFLALAQDPRFLEGQTAPAGIPAGDQVPEAPPPARTRGMRTSTRVP